MLTVILLCVLAAAAVAITIISDKTRHLEDDNRPYEDDPDQDW